MKTSGNLCNTVKVYYLANTCISQYTVDIERIGGIYEYKMDRESVRVHPKGAQNSP